jgi:hypothetical protein
VSFVGIEFGSVARKGNEVKATDTPDEDRTRCAQNVVVVCT